MVLYDNVPKIGWTGTMAKHQTASQAELYLEYLEHRIENDQSVKGTQICVKKGKVEGVAERSYMRHDVLPVAVAIRVDKKRSYVYNIKHETRTITVPTEMALATVRFINGENK